MRIRDRGSYGDDDAGQSGGDNASGDGTNDNDRGSDPTPRNNDAGRVAPGDSGSSGGSSSGGSSSAPLDPTPRNNDAGRVAPDDSGSSGGSPTGSSEPTPPNNDAGRVAPDDSGSSSGGSSSAPLDPTPRNNDAGRVAPDDSGSSGTTSSGSSEPTPPNNDSGRVAPDDSNSRNQPLPQDDGGTEGTYQDVVGGGSGVGPVVGPARSGVNLDNRTRPSEQASDAELRETIRRQAVEDSSLTPSQVRVTGFERSGGELVPVVRRRREEDGQTQSSVPSAYREQVREDATDDFEAISPSEAAVTVDDGEVGVRFSAAARERQRRSDVAEQFDEQFPDVDISAEDIEPTEDGRYTVDENVANRIATSRRDVDATGGGANQRTGSTSPSAQTDAPIELAREQYAERVSEETGQDYSTEDVTAERTEDGQVQFSVDRRESFDVDLSLGFGGPEDEVESTIDDLASGYSTRANELGETLFATDTGTENSAGASILRAAGRPDLASNYDQGVRNLGAGAVSGGLQIANVPGLVGSGIELAEVGVSGARETASGSGGEFLSDVGDRGSAIGEGVVEQANANRAQTAGMLVGSLGVSAGAISAASRIGSRTGTATRLAIQPGEELVGRAGFRATRATAGEQRAQQLFPNREPLLLSEEAAIRGGRAATDAARRAGSSTASRVARESTALRFRVEESLRSDAPSRGTSDNFVSRAGERAQQEAVSARFQAAETAQDVREGARSRAQGARDTLNEFAADERGQMQPPRSQLRGESDARQLEQPGGELNQQRVSDDLAGQRGGQIERSRLREPTVDRDGTTSPELEPDARSTSRPRSRLRVEPALGSTTESPLSMMRSAQEASVETSPLTLGGTESRLSTGLEAETEARGDTRGRTDLESELRTGFEGRTDTRTDLRSRQETRSELAFETETRRRETEPFDITTGVGDGESFFGDLLGEGDVVERDLINPFTGR